MKKMNEISMRHNKRSESILNTSSTEKDDVRRNSASNKLVSYTQNEKQRKINYENERLLKKLYEIGHKKSGFNKQSKAEQQYYFINMKSRQLHRDIK